MNESMEKRYSYSIKSNNVISSSSRLDQGEGGWMGAKNKGNGAFISVYTLGYLGTEPGYFGCTREKYPVIYPGTPQIIYPSTPQSAHRGTPENIYLGTLVPPEYIPGYPQSKYPTKPALGLVTHRLEW